MSPLKKILILCSGGDAPGMNAAVRAVVRSAIQQGFEVFGAQGGFQGIIDQKIIALDSKDVGNIIQRGGTILQTGRCPAFFEKTTRDLCRRYLAEMSIQGLIVLGGDGSFRGATILEKEGGPKTMGIPCTIDNDIVGTEYTIGFDTASNTALAAIDKIRDTASSLGRNFLVEVMGRASGAIAVDVGLAGGAEFILIPEVSNSMDLLIKEIQRPDRHLKSSSIIVVAEAGQPGRSFKIAEEIKEKTGVEYKVCVLAHLQRGGTPTLRDRKIATLMGYRAVELLSQGHSSKMISVQKENIIAVDFSGLKDSRTFSEKELLHINTVVS